MKSIIDFKYFQATVVWIQTETPVNTMTERVRWETKRREDRQGWMKQVVKERTGDARIDRAFDYTIYWRRARAVTTPCSQGAIKFLTFWPSHIKRLRINCGANEREREKETGGIQGCLSCLYRWGKSGGILIPIKTLLGAKRIFPFSYWTHGCK